jgi:hypothetical protein
MKKMFFLMLALLVLGAASMNAQVTIGSDKEPHAGAVLDLQSDNLGLKLPNVSLNDLTVFGLPVTETATAADAKGMYIYNTNTDVGEGVYVWDGYQWILLKASKGENPVQSITLNSALNDVVVARNQSIQLVPTITPSDATFRPLVWSIDRATALGSISSTGLFSTGFAAGRQWVTVSVPDGPSSTREFIVLSDDMLPPLETIGSNEYKTYNFNGDVWMVENSREGVSMFQSWKDEGEIVCGFYYNEAQARTAGELGPCPDPWHLPTTAEANRLMEYLRNDGDPDERAMWMAKRGGRYRYSQQEWVQLGTSGYFWVMGTHMYITGNSGFSAAQSMGGGNEGLQVRCMKNQ